jgi:hypothetical protein
MTKSISQMKLLFIFASKPNSSRPSFLPSTFRLSTLGLLLTFNFSFLTLYSCGLDIEDPTPPSPPFWVQKSFPEEWPERGIDAHESGGIYLEWEPNPEENIAAYLIFCARHYQENDSLGKYEILENYIPDSQLNFLHSDAVSRIKYFYKLKVEDFAGNLSFFSDSIGYTLLPGLDTETMTPNGNNDTLNNDRLLTWNHSYNTQMENFCLTVLTQNNDLVIRVQISPTDYVNGQESWPIPESLLLDSSGIFKWRIDMGAQYVFGLETVGSESAWATFLYYRD